MAKILILGLGNYPQGSGVEAALYFARRGDEVCVTDQKTASELPKTLKRLKSFKNIRYALGGHTLDDIAWADVIVPNPRVRPESDMMREARRLRKTITSDIALFLEQCTAPTVGVTGTRGKSTTSSLIAEMLRAAKKTVWLGGNISVSPLAFLDQVKPEHWVVLELSSWQLELTGHCGVSPKYALWTNLMRDHLNTYSGMDAYAEAKAQIFRHQQPDDLVMLPSDNFFDGFAETAPSRVKRLSLRGAMARLVRSVHLNLLGEHNRTNAIYAASMAHELGVSDAAIKRALRQFPGLANRLEIRRVHQGVHFINDTTSTTPDAAKAAFDAVLPLAKNHSVVHWIVGGADKELDFEDLATAAAQYDDLEAYVLPGNAQEKIIAAFEAHEVPFETTKSLKDALKRASANARRGDVVLLSPAAASFGEFKNEYHRGEVFNRFVEHLA